MATTTNDLLERLRKPKVSKPAAGKAPAAKKAPVLEPEEEEEGAEGGGGEPGREWSTDMPVWEQVEIEAVVAGALMRVRFAAGVGPREAVEMLKAEDASVQFRTGFPTSRGSRETKKAVAVVVNVRSQGDARYVDITCQNGEGDLNVSVPKGKVAEFAQALAGLGALAEAHVEKITGAINAGGSATVILPDEERFAVVYWTTGDGRSYLEGVERAATDGKAEKE